MFTEVLVALVVGGVIYFLVQKSKRHQLKSEDGWWGEGTPPDKEEDVSIRPYTVRMDNEELQDLYTRIDQTQSFPSLEDSQFTYGFNSQYLQNVVSYWRHDFDWRRQVEKLNKYPHYKTNIEGIDVHYVHVRPKNLPEGVTAVPLLMVHGWPGSFYEFYRMIPLLTEPSNPGDIVFEVVCPSIPGYCFSEAPHKKGKWLERIESKKEDFQQFYAHGGDWGWIVTTNMAQLEPKIIKGLHLNFAPPSKPGLPMVLSIMLGRRFPKMFGFNEHDIQRIYPIVQNLVVESVKESGYMHIQATKPDTVGKSRLNDSPVCLAAYILEKISTWTDHDFRTLDDGGLTRKFSLVDLLTNVMIYLKELKPISCFSKLIHFFTYSLPRMPVHVPTGFACFPNELMHTPKLWVQQKYRKLKTFTPMARGGHFATMEEPELMAQDIQNFTKMQEKRKK
uniref:Epoxide hydrolase n=1 Tax=Hucho hucho TaxID=62062 RepID=A0A4W5NWG2_9TELE